MSLFKLVAKLPAPDTQFRSLGLGYSSDETLTKHTHINS